MSERYAPQTPREMVHAGRARKARLWAWPVRLLLVLCAAIAIWQEPRIWPQAHGVMQGAAERVAGVIESDDRVRGFLATLTGERVAGARVGLADKLTATLSR